MLDRNELNNQIKTSVTHFSMIKRLYKTICQSDNYNQHFY